MVVVGTGVEAVASYLRDTRSVEVLDADRETLAALVDRRSRDGIASYLDRLEDRPDEAVALVADLLASCDPNVLNLAAWDRVLDHALDRWLARGEPVRVWVPDCGDGAPAYAAVAVLADRLDGVDLDERIEVYATDRDRPALEGARRGLIPGDRLGGLPNGMVERWFERRGEGFEVPRELRRLVTFAANDLEHDRPTSDIDVVASRYALVPYDPFTQVRVLERFHTALRGGYLITGSRQRLPRRGRRLFRPVEGIRGLHARVERVRRELGSVLDGRGPIRCALVDRSQVRLQGMARVLEEILGDALVVVARERITTSPHDIVLPTDADLVVVDLAGEGALPFVRETAAAYPDVGILGLATDDRSSWAAALEAGVDAIVPPGHEPSTLAGLILAVADGWTVVPRRWSIGRAEDTGRRDDLMRVLDAEELRLWQLVAEGCFDSEIAGELYVSERTVKRRVAALLRRIGVARRIEAATLAGQLGILDVPVDDRTAEPAVH